VTTMVEKALSYSPGFYFKKFPYYLDVFIVFFLASLFIFYQSPMQTSVVTEQTR
jgi:hypothetical protein